MNVNAITIANWFVDKANSETKNEQQRNPLTLLRLVKLVYISYGFTLALLDKSILDPRFDRVEAWKYGPVIPSVYHSFKHNGNNAIKEKEAVISGDEMSPDFVVPTLDEATCLDKNDIKGCLEFVWNRYHDCNASELVDILHQKNTPWQTYYVEGKNCEIPERTTKIYYSAVVDKIKRNYGIS